MLNRLLSRLFPGLQTSTRFGTSPSAVNGRNVTAGNFYYKKGNYRAAMRRYEEATKWDPTSGDALLKLAAADEKLHDFPGAREAYNKFLALDPDVKAAAEVRKKLAKLPPERSSAKSKDKKDAKAK